MYSRMSNRDAFGRPIRYASALEAGLRFPFDKDGLVFCSFGRNGIVVDEMGNANLAITGSSPAVGSNGYNIWSGGGYASQAPYPAALPVGNTPHTLSASFLLPHATGTSATRVIFALGCDGGGTCNALSIANTVFHFERGSGGIDLSDNLVDGAWHTATASYNGNGTTSVYIDGALKVTYSCTLNLGNGRIHLNCAPWSMYAQMDISIGNCLIYNRALTAEEVAKIAQKTPNA